MNSGGSPADGELATITARLHQLDALLERLVKPLFDSERLDHDLESKWQELLHAANTVVLSESHEEVLTERDAAASAKMDVTPNLRPVRFDRHRRLPR